MNTVKLIGNVGQNPSIRTFKDAKLASFSIATNEKYLDKNEEEISNTQWHNVVAWGKVADDCEKLLAKGKFIAIEGKLQTRHYLNKENKKVFVTEVLAKNIKEVVSDKKEKVFFL